MYGKKLPVGVRILLGFLSVLLCVLLFVSTVVTIVVADFRVVTSKDGLKTIITQALFPTSAPVRLPVGGLAAGRPVVFLDEVNVGDQQIPEDMMNGMGDMLDGLVGGTGSESQSALIDAIHSLVSGAVGEDVEISKEQVENFVKNSTVSDFVTDKVAGVVSDLVAGESTTTLTKEEVVTLLEENAAVIEQEMGIAISTEDIQTIGNWVEESKVIETVQQEVAVITGMAPPPSSGNSGNNGSGEGDTGNAGNLGGSHQSGAIVGMAPDGKDVISAVTSGKDVTTLTVAEILAVVRTVTSVTALLCCIGVCAVLIGLLFLTHWGRPFAAIRSAGIPVMIAGIVIAIPGILAMAVPSLFTGVVMVVIRQVLTLTGYVSIGVAVFGLVLIVVGAVLNSMMKKRAKAKLTAAEEVMVEAPAEPAVEEIAAEVLSVEE